MIRHHSSVCRCGIANFIVLTNAPGNINPMGEGWGGGGVGRGGGGVQCQQKQVVIL